MATTIDCRAYYIDSHCRVTETSRQTSCRNLNNNNNNNNNGSDTGSGISISKYLIDESGGGRSSGIICRNSSCAFPDDRHNIVRVADNFTNGAANASARNDARSSTSGHARQRSARGRLRRAAHRLETLRRDIKVVYHRLTFFFSFR